MLPRLAALTIAVSAFIATLGFVAVGVPWLLRTLYGWSHPGDASVDDTAGWALLLLSPILLPIALLLAAFGAFAAYSVVTRRLMSD